MENLAYNHRMERCSACHFAYGVGQQSVNGDTCINGSSRHALSEVDLIVGLKQLQQIDSLLFLRRSFDCLSDEPVRNALRECQSISRAIDAGKKSHYLEMINTNPSKLVIEPLIVILLCSLYEAVIVNFFEYLYMANGVSRNVSRHLVGETAINKLKEKIFPVLTRTDVSNDKRWKDEIKDIGLAELENLLFIDVINPGADVPINGYYGFRNRFVHGEYSFWSSINGISDEMVECRVKQVFDLGAKMNNRHVYMRK